MLDPREAWSNETGRVLKLARQSTIHHERMPGDETGLIRYEKVDRVGDLYRLARPAKGVQPLCSFEPLFAGMFFM